ncbi:MULTISPECIES: FecR family protein [Pseudomonas]|uniref:FecR family protein n=1 Tax=Pseudomonas TaxID=286 RepID=UPI0006961BC4|nr:MULTISPECIES: FecR family protein [Pseudomonas]MCO7504800.1 FecR family protein [Pseudomonas sp. VE 267-6A]MCO7531191.1 FecR family protein [Pseudomonas sp. 2]WEJ22408.1 FecR family protein [Pseudomonas sp. SD17-1]WKL66596.1 FecR family protein [Pseudomonas qingdaonensis]
MNLPAATLRKAAEWLVRLDDSASAGDQQAFEAWLASDPQHLEAVRQLQGSLAPLRELPRAPARAALKRIAPQPRGKRALKALAISLGLLLPAGLVLQHYPPAYLMADIRTGSGQWTTQQLPDGSRISLDGRSAVDLQFDAQSRTLRLLSGEILLDVAKDASRPFRVVTEHGSIRALGTRFMVERSEHSTRLAMLESSTEVKSAGSSRTVSAGQQVRFDATGIQPLQAVDAAGLEQAWASHQMMVKEQPLGEVLERLARNHGGYLLFDAKALAHLNVTAVLPADDSERALRLLARSFPIRVQHYTPWVTRVTLE